MPLPNLQDALKKIPEPFFWGSSRWTLLRDYSIGGQYSQLSSELTSVKEMCSLVERVYLALGYDKNYKTFCDKTESSDYLIIHSFLEAYTDGGKFLLVKKINNRYQKLDPQMIELLKEQLLSISVSNISRGIPDNVQLIYKASSVKESRFFSSPRSRPIMEDSLSDFECPISLELITDPIIAADGNTYDRTNLQLWYDQGNRTCPLNPGSVLSNPAELPTAHMIKKMISKLLEVNTAIGNAPSILVQ